MGSNTAGISSISFTRNRQVSLPPMHHLRNSTRNSHRYLARNRVLVPRNYFNRPVSLLMASLHDGHGPPLKKSSSLYWLKLLPPLIFPESKSPVHSRRLYFMLVFSHKLHNRITLPQGRGGDVSPLRFQRARSLLQTLPDFTSPNGEHPRPFGQTGTKDRTDEDVPRADCATERKPPDHRFLTVTLPTVKEEQAL